MTQLITEFRQRLYEQIRGEISEREPLDHRTTYRIGGRARFFVCPRDVEDLRELNRLIHEFQVPSFILGGGANVLVSDNGFDGVIIHLCHFDRLTFCEGGVVQAGAALVLDQFIVTCLKRGLAGLEQLSGIPGTLGGALRMNAGAFEGEISDHLVWVELMSREGQYQTVKKAEVGFSYRSAPLIRDTYILGAHFQFPQGSAEELFKIRETILARRFEKQPWQYPTAGSVFKRPPGRYAGKLIEDAGLKGMKIGRAQISPKHAGIIVNLGGAKAEEVMALIRAAQRRVREEFQVELELEQELVGFDSEGSESEPHE
ncbi:MAG: UDP-N-acetylmuramate dehydrogenase [Acidobacteriota bacterium]